LFHRRKLLLRYAHRLYRYVHQRQDKKVRRGALLIDNGQHPLREYLMPGGRAPKHWGIEIDDFLIEMSRMFSSAPAGAVTPQLQAAISISFS
jgi:hypothetical protein